MHKPSFAAFLLVSVSLTVPALAQDEEEGAVTEVEEEGAEDDVKAKEAPESATASILIEPLPAVFGFYEGDVGVAITDTIAAAIWGQYFSYELGDTGLSGYGIGLGAPIFFTGTAFRGAYVYPLVKFQKVEFTVVDEAAVTATFYGPLVTAGYQWTWGRPVGFSLRIGGGIEYSLGQLESDTVDQSLSYEGFDYELDAAIGVAF
jgi:uncharacterized membrane protein